MASFQDAGAVLFVVAAASTLAVLGIAEKETLVAVAAAASNEGAVL